MENIQYLNQKDLSEMFKVTVNTIRRWRKKGKIPQPIQLSYKTLVWERNELQNYIATRSLLSDQ